MHTSVIAGTPTQALRYPVDVECYAPIGEDRQLCHQRLVEESLSLFQIAGGGSAILRSLRDSGQSLHLQAMPILNIDSRFCEIECPEKFRCKR